MRQFTGVLLVLGSLIMASASHADRPYLSVLDAIPAHALLTDDQMARVEGRVAPVGAAAIGAVAGAVAGAVSSYATTGEVTSEAVLGGAVTGVSGAVGALATAGASVSALGIAYWTAVSSVAGAAAAAAGASYDSLTESLVGADEGANAAALDDQSVGGGAYGVLGAWAVTGGQWNVYRVSASSPLHGECGICYTNEWL